MPTYTITTQTPINTHCGHLIAFNEAQLALTEQQVEILFQIMEKAYADGGNLYKLDFRDTDLIYIDVELYDLINETYFDCFFQPYFENWVNRAYDRFDHVGNLIDWDRVCHICTERYGYTLKEVEGIDIDNFHDWFEKNIINADRLIDFERKENLLDLEVDIELDSPLLIPESLVKEFLDSHRLQSL